LKIKVQYQLISEKIYHVQENKMNCELKLTYDTPALWQTGSRNLTGQKTLPTIWGTYMKLVTKYQISEFPVSYGFKLNLIAVSLV
jgi:hypothetical protein